MQGLEVSEFTFYKHHQAASVDATRAYQATLAAEHTLANLLVRPLIFATTYGGVELAEVEVCEVARGAGCGAGATPYTGLQFGHLGEDVETLAQIVIIEVDNARTADAVSKVCYSHDKASSNLLRRYSSTAEAVSDASARVSARLFGAVAAPAKKMPSRSLCTAPRNGLRARK